MVRYIIALNSGKNDTLKPIYKHATRANSIRNVNQQHLQQSSKCPIHQKLQEKIALLSAIKHAIWKSQCAKDHALGMTLYAQCSPHSFYFLTISFFLNCREKIVIQNESDCNSVFSRSRNILFRSNLFRVFLLKNLMFAVIVSI